jgi:glyoxylate/hydroxypyruvate reductase A
MAERMSYHVLSQILEYQLNLKFFQKAQLRKLWQEGLQFQRQVKLNNQINVGILGVGFLGKHVGRFLQKLGYQVIGFKRTFPKEKFSFPIYINKDLGSFIKSSNIIVSILPATIKTDNFIDKKFLKKMKDDSLLINVGRGASINELDLISHLSANRNFFVSLDVFKKEPLIKKSLLWNMNNVTITPHVASITQVDTVTDQMYKKFLTFKRYKKVKTDVNLKKGY